jgi:hypothetical protein
VILDKLTDFRAGSKRVLRSYRGSNDSCDDDVGLVLQLVDELEFVAVPGERAAVKGAGWYTQESDSLRFLHLPQTGWP